MKVVLYLLVAVVALLLAAAFVLWLLYGDSPWPAAPPQVVEGGQSLRVVELDPKGLTVGIGDERWMVCERFELRVSEEGGVKSLLIRGKFVKNFTIEPDGRFAQSSSEELLYSDSYAVTLGGEFGVRKVDAAAWSRARPLKPEESETEFGAGASRRFYSDKGETLPKGGTTAGGLPLTRLEVGGAESEGWLLAEGGRYAAGFSHTTRRRRFERPLLIPFGSDDRILDGTMYVDLFDGATGRRLARATKGHKGSYDMYVFQQAVWFDGRYFAMPLDNWFGNWLVGALPVCNRAPRRVILCRPRASLRQRFSGSPLFAERTTKYELCAPETSLPHSSSCSSCSRPPPTRRHSRRGVTWRRSRKSGSSFRRSRRSRSTRSSARPRRSTPATTTRPCGSTAR